MTVPDTTALFDAFLRYELADVPPVVASWVPSERLAANLTEELQTGLARTNDRHFARQFMVTCPVPGASPQDYNYRLLPVRRGYVMTSIRFKGLDLAQPFVEVVFRDMPLDSAMQAMDLAREIAGHYETFEPRWVRVHDNAGHLAQAADGNAIVCDFRNLAAPLHLLREQPYPQNYNVVSLEPARHLDFYAGYRAAYDSFVDENRSLRGIVQPEARESLAELVATGTLFHVTVEQVWAGVIAVRRATRRYLHGYTIVEEVLAQGFRGRGLAAAVQRRLVDSLPAAGAALLFGQISPLNVASWRAARRVGRADVSGSYFVSIDT